MDILHALELYGFSKNEVLVYLYLLKNLEGTAFLIAKNTNIPRSTVYTILESLKKQGIISQFRKNNVAYFTPESPNRLLTLLKQKEEIMNEVMPQIRAVTSRSMDVPVAKLYVGVEGVKVGLEDVLETIKDQKIKQIFATSQPELLKYLPKYFPSWLRQREDLGVYTKLILPQSARNFLETNKLREVRYLPDKFPFNCSVTIYGNKAAFFSASEDDMYCMLIESESAVGMLKQFFLFTWEMLKPTIH